MTDLAKMMAANKAGHSTAPQTEDTSRVDEGGPDAAFATKNTGGGFGNSPADSEQLESVESGADAQTELNAASEISQAQGALNEAQERLDAGESAGKTWTSHPISRYGLGKYQFENGTLTLTDPEEIAEFEKLLGDKNLPLRDKAMIQEVSVDRANELARAFLRSRTQPGVTTSETGDTK